MKRSRGNKNPAFSFVFLYGGRVDYNVLHNSYIQQGYSTSSHIGKLLCEAINNLICTIHIKSSSSCHFIISFKNINNYSIRYSFCNGNHKLRNILNRNKSTNDYYQSQTYTCNNLMLFTCNKRRSPQNTKVSDYECNYCYANEN